MNYRNRKVVITVRTLLGLFLIMSGVSGLMVGDDLTKIPAPMVPYMRTLLDTGLFYMIKKLKNKNIEWLIMADEDVIFNDATIVFDIIDEINENTKIVLELSSHQLQNITIAPKTSVLLNIYQEHLDHYNSYEEYQESKMNLLKKQLS